MPHLFRSAAAHFAGARADSGTDQGHSPSPFLDHGAGLSTTRGIGEEPVFAAHHKGLNTALGMVVAQLQTAILQIPCQARLLFQLVVNGPAHRGFRRCFHLHLICP